MLNEKKLATELAKILISHGHETYFAGGCVRDNILGLEPKDYDLATSATPDEVLKLFPEGDQVGKHFGVIVVKSGGFNFEIATFRSDGSYSDNRRPDTVEFTNAEEDAKRRDFTINALFEHPLTGEIIDHVGGLDDIKNRVIRCVGDPVDRFREDALRMLRLFRFKAKLSNFHFVIGEETELAAFRLSENIHSLPMERINQELVGVLESPTPSIIEDVRYTFDSLFNTPFAVDGRYLNLSGNNHLVSNLALLDLGKEELKRLKFDNKTVKDVEGILSLKNILVKWGQLDIANKRKVVGNPLCDRVCETFWCGHPIVNKIQEFKQLFDFFGFEILPKPLVTGDHLIERGIKPSKEMGELLDRIYNFQLNSNNKELTTGELLLIYL